MDTPKSSPSEDELAAELRGHMCSILRGEEQGESPSLHFIVKYSLAKKSLGMGVKTVTDPMGQTTQMPAVLNTYTLTEFGNYVLMELEAGLARAASQH
jgi:hypothetical protein